jgi:hypothetical protein
MHHHPFTPTSARLGQRLLDYNNDFVVWTVTSVKAFYVNKYIDYHALVLKIKMKMKDTFQKS